MKLPSTNSQSSGLTRIELLVVLVILVALAGLILPAFQHSHSHNRARRISCVNNLKQVALSFRISAVDNNDSFPMQIADEKGGAKDSLARGEVFRVFLAMSNELSVPRTVLCPDDPRKAATNWASLSNSNISYFVGLDATNTRPNMILLGDRDLAENGQLLSGTVNLTTNRPVAWHKLLHKEGGNLLFADGSVQLTATLKFPGALTLRQQLANTGDATNRVLFPQ